ncbi:peptide-methionine-S-sulfoxide reductase [Mycosarcoma maydis]|uniref:peptide-methionine (S)-S-oxide reductase n=1 Tax=Mycosarcoma maydis TaxID=5270 RepID=A0A0D1CWC2_MYCMD|nr:peptide-methionine-S-sulfoxide reductase [Ustilago maydis 521]KIS70688.1 hypothetical protein UMAG_10260 [Ustilago maydis 521]|eukprot:XP_011387957.1 hypothetical protein UMAG_10260 [Ustilago maydis 521]
MSRFFSLFTRSSQPLIQHLGPPTTPTAQAAQEALKGSNAAMSAQETATVANGCFWGTEDIYRKAYGNGKGLLDAKVGFIGGQESSKNPSYEEVCTGRTGHAEAAQIVYDPSKVSYAEIIEFFYRTHDPTQLNQQGNDRGTQYRSAIFAHDQTQLDIAKKVTEEVQKKHFDPKGKKIVTQLEIRKKEDFFPADDYHQKYLINHPDGYHCSTHRYWW